MIFSFSYSCSNCWRMSTHRFTFTLSLSLIAWSFSASGQGVQTSPSTHPSISPDYPKPEIVVTAPVNPDDLPVQADGTTEAQSVSRYLGSEADRFVRCAGMPDPHDLRLILDHSPGEALAMRALHKFVVRNSACYGSLADPIPQSPYLGVCNPYRIALFSPASICRTTFDRGALYERAVKLYGGTVALTRTQTFDPNIRARFLRLEQERDKLRARTDREYSSVVGCMVQLSPQFGRALLEAAPGSEEETLARRLLIGHGAECVGSAAKVTADPVQFRAYTAQAVYAWLVATSNRPTLIKD